MKKLLAVILSAAMLLSLAACAAPAAETTTQAAAPSVSEAATPSPTEQPTPTPEPTPEPLTEGQQMYFNWLHLKVDIYACLVAYEAYETGELDSLIANGEISRGAINDLVNYYSLYSEAYEIKLDSILNEPDITNLSDYEVYIKIIKGLEISNLDSLDNYNIDVIFLYENVQNAILANGNMVEYAFSGADKVREMINLYLDIEKEECFLEFDEKMQGDYLNPKEEYYVAEYIFQFDMNNKFYREPTVIYQGEQIGFFEYNKRTGMFNNAQAALRAYLTEQYVANNG